jgi:superfamily I DNA/RNA helicase
MQLTAEQQAVIDTNFNLVINAVAGSGKTTTLVAYAKSRPANSRILYLAFNKTVKTEAQQKFAKAGVPNVKVETAHSLAYDHIIKYSNYNVIQGYKSYEWVDMLGINTGEKHTDYIIANHVNKFIGYFCNSKATKVQELQYGDVITDAKAKTFVNNFYSLIEKYTREALAKMQKAEISVTHDFYLKKFQLSNPVLPYDYILFDEGQDASAAMLEVFLQQPAIKIIVGDMHQQIYGWRYAINSLQQVDFPVYNLSNSFRFDDEVALVANKILAYKKILKQPPAVKIIGAGSPTTEAFTKATLGRSNLGLLLNAIALWQSGQIKNVYFEGNINTYTFADEGASLYDVLNLYNNKRTFIKDKLIATMTCMKDLEEYIEKTEDGSLSMIVEVVKQFGSNLPNLINELKSNHAEKKEDADMIFSTVHRCKGMEYDEVTLLKDFITEDKLVKQIAQMGGEKITVADTNRLAEEINILYVAATRAKNKLVMPPEINPLKSIVLAQELTLTPSPSKRGGYQSFDEWDLYSQYQSKATGGKRTNSSKPVNSGKPWNIDDEDRLEIMFHNHQSLKEIATELGRGERAVRMKLINLGLIEEDEVY